MLDKKWDLREKLFNFEHNLVFAHFISAMSVNITSLVFFPKEQIKSKNKWNLQM
jgi:hypothetical protein